MSHGADVKCVDWHPSKSLLASGSKDNQQPIKLWDPRSGQPLAKLHAHKSTVMDLKWNANGNWLCSASRDHLLKLFDIRNLSTEFQVFRGHKKEASCIAWHPHHEGLFASGGSDGSILFWHVGNDKEVGAIESAHDGIIWDLAWHPLGHILCSGSNDHTSKFWTRNRPGDKMRDKYNLNTLPAGVLADDSMDIDDIPLNSSLTSQGAIPGMGPDDKIEETETAGPETIPGLDFEGVGFDRFSKKTPYAKPIPKTFQAAWNAAGGLEEEIEEENSATSWVVTDSAALFCMPANIDGEMVYTDDGDELPPGSVPLNNIKANSILYCGFLIPLEKVAGDVIQNAFATMEEEDAIAEITGDFEFARKLIKEKNQLLNPNASEEPPEKKGGPQFGEQKNPNYGNSNNNTGNYQGSAGFQGMQQPFGGGPSGPHNPNSQRGNFRGQFDGGFNRGGPRGNWSHRGSGPRGGHNMGGMRDGGEQYEEGFDEDWGYDEQGGDNEVACRGGRTTMVGEEEIGMGRTHGQGRVTITTTTRMADGMVKSMGAMVVGEGHGGVGQEGQGEAEISRGEGEAGQAEVISKEEDREGVTFSVVEGGSHMYRRLMTNKAYDNFSPERTTAASPRHRRVPLLPSLSYVARG
ncbi:WD repeat-containing protein 33 [Penaeus vannamei]|uniref:WD repeat-containing protein 33 n=1 Tax=Penaeus vannamei TaxID=6689 RepID=A0A3R7MQ74_PENVA|nr:WD repeat-containing protein 33 [Penaeus vannamei]